MDLKTFYCDTYFIFHKQKKKSLTELISLIFSRPDRDYMEKNHVAMIFLSSLLRQQIMGYLSDICRVYQLSHGGSKQSACSHRQYNMEAKTRTDRCQPIMTFSASETMSAVDFCSFSSVLCESLFSTAFQRDSHSVRSRVWCCWNCAVCIEFNKAGVGDEVTGLQAIRLIQSANIRSLIFLLAYISYAYSRGNTKLVQGQALLLALCHLSHISRLGEWCQCDEKQAGECRTLH